MSIGEILELAGRLDDFTRRGARVELADDAQRLRILTRGNPDPAMMADLATHRDDLRRYLRGVLFAVWRRFPTGWRIMTDYKPLPAARADWLAYLRSEGIDDSEDILILNAVMADELTMTPNDLPDDWREYWIERAAIREHDGGFDRQEAERLALADTLQQMREIR